MKKTFFSVLLFIYEDFAPLAIFLIAERFTDLRGAIKATLIFVILDLIGRVIRKAPLSRLYWFSFLTTSAFGAIDIVLPSPVFFKYESVASNLLTAAFFGATLFRGKPLIQEFAEKTLPPEKAARSDIQQYLRILTMAWTAYFVVKAIVYAYVSYYYPIDTAIAFRSAVGTISLVVMLFGERLIRPKLFPFLKSHGAIR